MEFAQIFLGFQQPDEIKSMVASSSASSVHLLPQMQTHPQLPVHQSHHHLKPCESPMVGATIHHQQSDNCSTTSHDVINTCHDVISTSHDAISTSHHDVISTSHDGIRASHDGIRASDFVNGLIDATEITMPGIGVENSKKRGRKKKSPDERSIVPFSRTGERAKTIYEFYLQHGTKASAQEFNMSYGYVQVLVHKYRKFSNDTRSRIRGLRLPKCEKQQIYDYYCVHGYDETAKHFGYNKLFIYNLVRYYKSKLAESQLNIADLPEIGSFKAADVILPQPVEFQTAVTSE